MIGVALNGLLLIVWLALWGITGVSFTVVLPAIAISSVGLVVCALMDGLSR